MRARAIINPASGGGRTGREAAAIMRRLAEVTGPLDMRLTDGPFSAARLTAEALDEGIGHIIAVGGDGTLGEVVNGFFRDGKAVNPDAVLSFVTAGTGGDFRKTFGIAPGLEGAIAAIRDGRLRRVDVGHVSCLDGRGAPAGRYFLNIASFGLSGDVVQRVNRARIAKLFGGRFTFAWHSARAMMRYRSKPVRVRIDATFDEIVTISTVAVCNGRFFGGGMQVAPHAAPDDGAFDVVILKQAPSREAIAGLRALYQGRHVDSPHVRIVRGRRVIAAPVADTRGAPVHLDVDGEAPGRLPATFEIVPHALTLRC